MGKKGSEGEGSITLGSDAWNVADGYTKIKILRHLIQLDRYDTISQFGTEELDEGFDLNPNQIKKRRCEALERFVSTLKQLLGNVYFALKKDDDGMIKGCIERIGNIERVFPKVYSSKEDELTKEEVFEIEERLFGKIIKILQEIKDKINVPLNKAGLIFRPSEEIDLDKIMGEIIEGG